MREQVLRFWFEEIQPAQWWKKDATFDALIATRFSSLHASAARCELYAWRGSAQGRLAEIIVLDQFSRNIYRDQAASFANDPFALAMAQEAITAGADRVLLSAENNFLYMPFMHSESLAIHEVALRLFENNGLKSNLDFELRHKRIIEQFGRYPHRNAILGRVSTAEEIAFLKLPGSGF